MSSRAEAIVVTYLEKEVKGLRIKVARLEKRLRARDAELAQLKGGARASAKETRRKHDLCREVDRLLKNHKLDEEIIEEQRARLDQVREDTTPSKLFDQALTATRGLLPVTTERAKAMFRGKQSLPKSVGLLLSAYDDAMRVAQKAVGAPPNSSSQRV